MSKQRVWPGLPNPLGATWDGSVVNFALFSAYAEKVELCLFDKTGKQELEHVPLPEYTDEIWHGYFPDMRAGQLYGYRVYGPYEPEQWHRFNGHKFTCSIHMQKVCTAHCGGMMPYSVTGLAMSMQTCRSTAATVPPTCPDA